jgi:hypothetical protein
MVAQNAYHRPIFSLSLSLSNFQSIRRHSSGSLYYVHIPVHFTNPDILCRAKLDQSQLMWFGVFHVYNGHAKRVMLLSMKINLGANEGRSTLEKSLTNSGGLRSWKPPWLARPKPYWKFWVRGPDAAGSSQQRIFVSPYLTKQKNT